MENNYCSVTVWEPDTSETDYHHSVIPIQFIAIRTVSLLDEIDGLGNVIQCIKSVFIVVMTK